VLHLLQHYCISTSTITNCNINDLLFFGVVFMNYWIKNVFFAENDGLLFGIDIVPYSINKLLKLY